VEKWECSLKEFGLEGDHVHLLLSCHPSMNMRVFINNLKTVSSRMIRKEFDYEIRKKLWGKNFWTRAYCLLTMGGANIEKQLGNSSPSKTGCLDGDEASWVMGTNYHCRLHLTFF
jgi:putative transposase